MIASISRNTAAVGKFFAQLVSLEWRHRPSPDFPAFVQEVERLGYHEPSCGTVAELECAFLEAIAALSVRPDYGLSRTQAVSAYEAYAAQFTSVLRTRAISPAKREASNIPVEFQSRLLELGRRHAQAVCELCSDFGFAPDSRRSQA